MKLLRAVLILFSCLYLGKGLVYLSHLPIPGSIIGMLLLFLALSSGLVKGHWVSPFVTPLLRHMTLLFIPAGVGLMNYLDLISSHALALLGTTLLSTWLLILAVGTWHQRRQPHD
ncbi:CidA/LrgA family protein [Gallaecimonas kandeliae]|uniref:CidA/LrgA family protein n=1 Tax=Gallaecimonas kandeliae TaxID=3029055 RepID=UPI002649393A|nr:CidA/LrgA family protein [Gallaecimonas kandeliae]WKE66919.1 CidA/LrgA family protein [Gallaecimonas kandeliae]